MLYQGGAVVDGHSSSYLLKQFPTVPCPWALSTVFQQLTDLSPHLKHYIYGLHAHALNVCFCSGTSYAYGAAGGPPPTCVPRFAPGVHLEGHALWATGSLFPFHWGL